MVVVVCGGLAVVVVTVVAVAVDVPVRPFYE
jgi:hypothetical protein